MTTTITYVITSILLTLIGLLVYFFNAGSLKNFNKFATICLKFLGIGLFIGLAFISLTYFGLKRVYCLDRQNTREIKSTAQEEGFSYLFLSIFGVFVALLVTGIPYLLYTYYKDPSRVKSWFQDFRHGFVASGMPVWWTTYNNSIFGLIVRWLGPLSILSRSFMPSLKDHPYLNRLLLIFIFAFFFHLFVRGLCNIWSGSKYLWSGNYIKFNSPVSLEGTVRRLGGFLAKMTVKGTVETAAGTAGTVIILSQFQKECLEASDDQLLSTKVRNLGRLLKYNTGYSKPDTEDITIPRGPVKDLKDMAPHHKFDTQASIRNNPQVTKAWQAVRESKK